MKPERTVSGSVVVVGEALVDVVRAARRTSEHPGGGPANIAVGLGRLGVDVTLMTRLGSDSRGALIREHLAASGVQLWAGSITDESTSVATACIGGDGSAQYDFDIRWDLASHPAPEAPDVLHVGSIGAFLAPGARKVRNLVRRWSPREVTFDPNIRPALIGDHPSAVTNFEETASLASVVKLSDEDAGWLYPSVAAEDVLGRILALGPRLAVMTRGSRDSLLATAENLLSVPSTPASVVDTIGAGDTYMASLIAFLATSSSSALDREALLRVGRRAARAAAITVSRAGADLPWANELALPLD